MTRPPDAEFEADLINGRACASCGGGITPENRVPHGGFWLCQPGCDDDINGGSTPEPDSALAPNALSSQPRE